ncbi:hypothetical protein M433DRAFT_250171 [Acidomyces richmondensis BFW]|nr:MAG: hypothetical protein FE78DRAFT_416107 [Acidomyces sp. 'richmondensis']KYG45543.1 hypothetical protein M433DRAFT_250171 [Acidomyces richmondensis BFW]
MNSLAIEPLVLERLDEWISIYWAAFEVPEVDMILPMIYPMGLTPELLHCLRNRLLRETDGNLRDCYFAKDRETDDIIGISRWTIKDHVPQSQEEIQEEVERVTQARKADFLEGMNVALGDAALKAKLPSEYETMKEHSKYANLILLAVHPKYHRRGVGTLLLKHGLENVDRLHLPVYVESGVYGKLLYEREGFKTMCDFPFDGREYGGRSKGRHWCMVRPPKP